MGLTNFEQMLVDSNGNAYGVSGSMPLPVGAIGQLVAGVNSTTGLVEYLSTSGGAVLVTGSIAANVTFPSDIVVSPFSPSGFWSTGPMAVSGAIHTGSTANGFPVTVGGVYYGSGNVGNLPAYVQSIQVDPSGSVYITTTGSLAVAPGDGAVFPVAVQGTVPVSLAQAIQVWQEGPVGVTGSVSVANFPANQQVWTAGPVGVTASVNLPVWQTGIVGVSASVQIPVYSTGLVGVSGTVSVTQPVEVWQQGLVGVTGSYASGSVATAPVFPVLEGGLDRTNTVRPFLTDPQGRLTNPVTGSTVTSIAASTVNQMALAPNVNRVGATFFNEGGAIAFLKFGQTATQTSYTVQLASKAYYELPLTYQGEIDVVFNSNNGNLRVTELY